MEIYWIFYDISELMEPTGNLFKDFNGWFLCHVPNYGLSFEINENLLSF
jgi:hypothetical protein